MISFVEQLAFESTISFVSALFIGIATAIAPCTFATNVAAISYIAHYVDNPNKALMTAISFTLGRMITYVSLGLVMISAGRVVGSIARDTQSYGNLIIGPLLIIIGFAFTGAFSMNISFGNNNIQKYMPSLAKRGLVGPFIIGSLFALAFCPYSGMLFFGLLIPLSLSSSHGVVLPGIFGIGVSIPVIIFSALIYVSASRARNFGRWISTSWTVIGKALGLSIIVVGCYSIAPYLEEWGNVSYAFELATTLFCCTALYLLLNAAPANEIADAQPATRLITDTEKKQDLPKKRTNKNKIAGNSNNPHTGGIPRKP